MTMRSAGRSRGIFFMRASGRSHETAETPALPPAHQLAAQVLERHLRREPRLVLDRHVVGLRDLARLERHLIAGEDPLDVGRRELAAVGDDLDLP